MSVFEFGTIIRLRRTGIKLLQILLKTCVSFPLSVDTLLRLRLSGMRLLLILLRTSASFPLFGFVQFVRMGNRCMSDVDVTILRDLHVLWISAGVRVDDKTSGLCG